MKQIQQQSCNWSGSHKSKVVIFDESTKSSIVTSGVSLQILGLENREGQHKAVSKSGYESRLGESRPPVTRT